MTYDYFYGQQSELFTFYRVPKVLFTNERFWNISADAKMLYGNLVKKKAFHSVRIGGSIRISKKSFDEWLDQQM